MTKRLFACMVGKLRNQQGIYCCSGNKQDKTWKCHWRLCTSTVYIIYIYIYIYIYDEKRAEYDKYIYLFIIFCSFLIRAVASLSQKEMKIDSSNNTMRCFLCCWHLLCICLRAKLENITCAFVVDIDTFVSQSLQIFVPQRNTQTPLFLVMFYHLQVAAVNQHDSPSTLNTTRVNLPVVDVLPSLYAGPTRDCRISHGHWKASAGRRWENGGWERRWRWEGPGAGDVSGCVEEYRLCCQPSVSLMKIGMQVSCHSFSMSVHGSRAFPLQPPPLFPLFSPLSLPPLPPSLTSLQKAGHYSYSQTAGPVRERERERQGERERGRERERERKRERVREGGKGKYRGGGEKREREKRGDAFLCWTERPVDFFLFVTF